MKLEELTDRLEEFDLLLDTDPKFPSITGLVVGDDVHGSWWAHPRAHEMYGLACALRARPDVLVVKLISRKVTLVRRALWPAVYAIGLAREPWQLRNLSKEAVALLKKVDRAGEISASGDPVRDLENRLLVQAESVHTERGFHMKQVRSWQAWAKSAKLGKVKLSPAEAKVQLESVVERINKKFHAAGKLPWQVGRARKLS